MSVKDAILQKKIEGIIYDLMIKTNAANVEVDDKGTTLAAKLSEIVAAIATKATLADIDNRINALVNGAPTAYDTLKEIADYIAEHQEVTTALNAAIGNKVDKVTGKGLSTNDFTAALKTKLEGLSNYTHPATHPATMIVEDNDHKFATKEQLDKIDAMSAYTHPDSGVSAGSYRKVTVNAQGHVTAGSNPTVALNEGGTGATTAKAARDNLGAGRVLAGAAAPADLSENDLFIQIAN